MCGGWLPLARAAHAQIHSFPVERTEGGREDKIDGSPDFFAVRLRRACLSGLFGTPSLSPPSLSVCFAQEIRPESFEFLESDASIARTTN